jgi:hypothetical protein
MAKFLQSDVQYFEILAFEKNSPKTENVPFFPERKKKKASSMKQGHSQKCHQECQYINHCGIIFLSYDDSKTDRTETS